MYPGLFSSHDLVKTTLGFTEGTQEKNTIAYKDSPFHLPFWENAQFIVDKTQKSGW
jgi:hypothetical protein